MEIKKEEEEDDRKIIRTCMYCKEKFGCTIFNNQNSCVTCTIKQCLTELAENLPVSHGICHVCYPAALQAVNDFAKAHKAC